MKYTVYLGHSKNEDEVTLLGIYFPWSTECDKVSATNVNILRFTGEHLADTIVNLIWTIYQNTKAGYVRIYHSMDITEDVHTAVRLSAIPVILDAIAVTTKGEAYVKNCKICDTLAANPSLTAK